jgi:hypothetical protein
MMRKGAELPNACIKCGQPPRGTPLRKTYYWQPSGLFRFLPFPFSFVALIVALVVRRKITIELWLCSLHRRRRAIGLLLTWLFCGLGLGAIGVGLNWAMAVNDPKTDNAPMVIMIGIALMLIGALCFVFAGRLLSLKRIDEDTATFTGAGARFLQLLPDSPNFKR